MTGAATTDRPRLLEIAPLGLRSAAIEVGEAGAEEAVVLLHGQPGSARDWTPLLPRLAGVGRVVALDLPGFGRAERPRDWDYSAGTYACFLAAALAGLGVRRAHLVMHDLGGIGLLWGAAHPDAFASAVLIDTGVLLGFRWHPLARLYRAPVLGELATAFVPRPAFRAVMRAFNPQPRPLPRWWLEETARGYDRGGRRAGLRFYRETPPAAIERIAPVLRALDRPALVIWGAHDPAVPAEQAERQRESFPRAEVSILPDSGHWPHLDDPDRVADLLVPFLEARLARAGAA